jgi:hypothetical protein
VDRQLGYRRREAFTSGRAQIGRQPALRTHDDDDLLAVVGLGHLHVGLDRLGRKVTCRDLYWYLTGTVSGPRLALEATDSAAM